MTARPRDDAPKLGAVILAAGAGRRLGGVAKALITSHGHSLLARIAATARAVGLVDGVVVVGPPHGDAVAAHAHELGLRSVVNARPERGMASSVALGFTAIAERDADAAWLWPVDHPAVMASTLAALADALAGHEVARPRFAGRGGHPPLVARALWPRLAACALLEDGARGVIGAARAIAVDVDDPGVARDVDYPDDLEQV